MIHIGLSLFWFVFVMVTWRLSPQYGEGWLSNFAFFNFGMCAFGLFLGVDHAMRETPRPWHHKTVKTIVWMCALGCMGYIVYIFAKVALLFL